MSEHPIPRDLPPLIRQHALADPDTPAAEEAEGTVVEEPPC